MNDMHQITAETRTVVKRNYALITPDSYVNSVTPGWNNSRVRVVISPEMGARFSQYLIDLHKKGAGTGTTAQSEIFFFVMEGECIATVDNLTYKMKKGFYLYVPPGQAWSLKEINGDCRLLSFQKIYEPLEGEDAPYLVYGDSADLQPAMYLEDPQLHMQFLLPDRMSFDMAVNIFTYQPGGNLPFVETHIMEHGLIYLQGQGIYRLDTDWYAVAKGDCIWMAPYCPQWFTAMGKEPAVYIYYKNVNRFSILQ